MAIVFKTDGFLPQNLYTVVSPLSELMALLHILAEPDHHLEARGLLDHASASMDEPFLSEFRAFSPFWARYRCRLFFPFGSASMNLDSQLRDLEFMPEDLFVELAAEGAQGNHGLQARANDLLHSTQDRADFLSYCRSRSSERYDLAVKLLTNPDRVRIRLVEFLEEANTRLFKHEWPLVQDEIQHSAELHKHEIRTLPATEAMAGFHSTAQFNPETATVRFDKLQRHSVNLRGRTVIAVPSVHIGAHLVIKWHPRGPVVIHFPVRRTGAGPVGINEMRARLASLTSETRMEIFRHLAAEPITTSEIASRTGQSSAQISRELRTLRGAGLLLSERRGRHVYHRINLAEVLELGPNLINSLLR